MMKSLSLTTCLMLGSAALSLPPTMHAADAPKVPRFSPDYMDRSVGPETNFFLYAEGSWVRNNPVPSNKARWGAFQELQERNWFLLHEILDSTLSENNKPAAKSPADKVGEFYRSAMDTNLLEKLALKPLDADLKAINKVKSTKDLMQLLADFHERGIGCVFSDGVSPDAKNSSVYAFSMGQGGLSLPDRDYYLKDNFAKQREAYLVHLQNMFALLGESQADAKVHAGTVLSIETELAKVSKTRVELRDPIANYHKFETAQLATNYPSLQLLTFIESTGLNQMPDLIVHQPEFFAALDGLIQTRPLSDWKVYLRWHLLRSSAPYLNSVAENESFRFFGTVLSGQPSQEPRWQRSGKVIDRCIGEALGQLFVEKHFPPAAKARMNELVGNVKAVFRDRVQKLDWMTEATKTKALAKFDRFTEKIGYPDKFRDYSSVEIRRDDYLGNVRRAAIFESKRDLARVGKQVDRTEWHMTPPTVNAYFNPSQNEIVFPAGILQPPFFDMEMDDAVNYGAIGVVIGHEITHGYDDQGRKFDADGNLNDWWTADDAKAFDSRAQKVIDQYNAYEPLPGLHVDGKLTLGENIADLGGTRIAYEALQRALAKEPSKRKNIDGLTPEQRFFISLSQIWRITCREDEVRRLVATDPHSPGQFRAVGPHVNMTEFFDLFGIKEGTPMWRPESQRATIW